MAPLIRSTGRRAKICKVLELDFLQKSGHITALEAIAAMILNAPDEI